MNGIKPDDVNLVDAVVDIPNSRLVDGNGGYAKFGFKRLGGASPAWRRTPTSEGSGGPAPHPETCCCVPRQTGTTFGGVANGFRYLEARGLPRKPTPEES